MTGGGVPTWALAGAYWLHMAATVVWIGGVFFQAAILAPAMRAASTAELSARLLHQIRRRFTPLAWLSLGVLVATGLTQMASNPNYTGFLTVTNRWSAALLGKHLTIGAMAATAAYQTWVLQPALERSLLRSERQPGSGDSDQRRYQRMTAINLALALLVLGLTAVARTA